MGGYHHGARAVDADRARRAGGVRTRVDPRTDGRGTRSRQGEGEESRPTVQAHSAPEAGSSGTARGRGVAQRDREELQCQQQHNFEVGELIFSPEWRALGREAALASEQIASGITALGHANHAQTGLYNQAFFGLSIGAERTAKLIIVAAHAIENSGSFPTNSVLRNIGHNVSDLFDRCDEIGKKYRQGEEYAVRPDSHIHRGIVKTLTEFGKRSRYYNLDFLVGDESTSLPDPIAAWWERVAVPILATHYTEKQKSRDMERAQMAGVLGGNVAVIYHREDGSPVDNIRDYMLLGGATRVVQTYGRLYTLQLVRWISLILDDLSRIAAYEKRIEALLGLSELFAMFNNEDKYLRDRKRWSVYRP